MALVVGELTAFITIDDRAVDPSLRRAESALRSSGQTMGNTADQAGQAAGRQLGEGLVRGADGQWRHLNGDLADAVTAAAADAESAARRGGQRVGQRFGDALDDEATRAARQAGDDAGDALGDGLGATGGAGADAAVGGIGEKLGGLKLAAAGVGAAAGALLMSAFTEALDQGQIVGRLGAQLGATPAEAKKYGELAGSLYANAVTEDFQSAADTISAVMRAGIAPPDATEAQLESIATKVSDLASTFELDLGQTANAVGQMIKTGLAEDGVEAVDALTAGLQQMGPRADDIADTFNEYSTIFRQMGLDATTATGLLSQGMKAGARDTDVVADSLKEFVLITQGGGEEVDKAFAKIGLSGQEMQRAFTEGGPKATAALDEVFDRLRKVKDPTDRAQIALALFGTKAEDTQNALMALDPSEATAALGEVGGAADRMGDSLRDNAGTRLTQFQRGLQQNVVDFLGGTVIPAITTFKTRAQQEFSSLWDQAGQGNQASAERVAAFMGLVAQAVVAKIREYAPQAASAFASLGQSMAAYVAANPVEVFKIAAIGAAFLVAIAALPAIIAGGLLAAAGTITVNFVQGLVEASGRNLPKWGMAIYNWLSGLWSKYVSGPVSRTWDSFIGTVKALPGRTVVALAVLGSRLASAASQHWQRFKDGSAAKVTAFVSWVRGIPGRIRSGVGQLGNLLYSQGRDVVLGLWRGISGMGGWLRGQLMSFARNIIPGPVAKALGISSPSKVMAKQVGRWIPRGIVAGIESTAGEVDSTMASLVSTPTPSASYAGAVGTAMSTAGGVSGSGAIPTVRITAGDALSDQLMQIIRDKVGVYGGDVQVALGPRRR